MSGPGAVFMTVLTPAYNRAGMLPALYESLLRQSEGGFDWLIVDDGSSDGTEALAAGWIAEGKLPIRYIRRENGGKHRALNTGLLRISAPLTFIVDSDDTLLPDAVAHVLAAYRKYGSRDGVCGYSFLRIGKDGRSVAAKALSAPERVATFAQARLRENNPGDMAEVWFTEALRKHPFPEYPGEKFYSETGVWLRISGEGRLVYINQPVYECVYYSDGLTKNRKKAQIGSPLGVMDVSRQLMARQCGLRWNARGALRYCVFGHRLGMGFAKMARESGRAWLVWLCALPSVALRSRWGGDKAGGEKT